MISLNLKNKKNFIKIFIIISAVLVLFSSLSIFITGCVPKMDIRLYFAKYEDNIAYLVPETREMAVGQDMYKKIIEEIIKGPESEQIYPVLPSDVKVNSVTLVNGLATVDFSKEIITNSTEIPHSSTTENLAIFSIVDTLTEFKEIQKVRFTIEGMQSGQIDGLFVEDFWGHLGIYDDFSRNEQILTKDSGI